MQRSVSLIFATIGLKALGAEISAVGSLSPNFDAQMKSPDPTGVATVLANNLSPAITSLVSAGLIEPQMAMAAMGATAMFLATAQKMALRHKIRGEIEKWRRPFCEWITDTIKLIL